MRTLLFLILGIAGMAKAEDPDSPRWLEALAPVIQEAAKSAGQLPDDRRAVLERAAGFVAERLSNGQQANLTFICTHNSRRSHLAQLWAQVAAEYYGLQGVETFSGGTEATACNIRTVRALRRAGLEIVAADSSNNPKYLVQYADNRPPMEVYSKVYHETPNPQEAYAAMMCCSDVDERCPVVKGAAVRIPLHYIDPKVADDTEQESETYDQRSRQIAGEMFYLFSRVENMAEAPPKNAN